MRFTGRSRSGPGRAPGATGRGWPGGSVHLHRPFRGLARSHRCSTAFKPCAIPVGAGKPAKRPVQATAQ
ncbi:hypothetical protein GEV38_17670 [Pseudomonas sp. 13159349]|nr:hypothetical protein GEV38_17670 [Pseudomonas sp. 13159349]